MCFVCFDFFTIDSTDASRIVVPPVGFDIPSAVSFLKLCYLSILVLGRLHGKSYFLLSKKCSSKGVVIPEKPYLPER